MRPRILSMCLAISCGMPGVRDGAGGGSDDSDSSAESAEARIQERFCEGGIPIFEVCPCYFRVDWSQMTEDLLGNPVDPAGFETLGMMYVDVGVDEFLAARCDGAVKAASVHGYVDGDARGKTVLDLSSMSFLGTPAQPFEVGSTVELVWSSSDMPGVGVEMVVLLSIVDGGSDSISVVWP